MKTDYLSTLIVTLVIAISLGSCSSMNTPHESMGKSLASYHEKTFRIKSNKPLEGTDTTYFYMAYPVFSDSIINHYALSNIILDSGATSVEDMGKTFILNYDDFYDEVDYKRAWFEEKKIAVITQSKSYIGFSTQFASYTGGAHGIHYTLFNNYHVGQQKEIKITSLVNDYAALTTLGEEYFRQMEWISASHLLSTDYFFENGEFSLPNNFTLEKDSLMFLYNVYEIKPYVFGTTSLRIPFTALSDLLTLEAKGILSEIKN